MKEVRAAKLKYALEWLRDRKDADIQEKNRLDRNFDLETSTLELHHQHKQQNYQQEIKNIQTRGENQQRIWEGLAQFSGKASQYIQKKELEKKQREFDQGVLDAAYGKAVTVEEQVGQMAAENAASDQASANAVAAQIPKTTAQRLGVSSLASKSYTRGYMWYKAKELGASQGRWLNDVFTGVEKLTNNDGTPYTVLVTRADGTIGPVPVDQLEPGNQMAEAASQLLGKRFRDAGFGDYSLAFLQPAISAARSETESYLSGKYEEANKNQISQIQNQARDTLRGAKNGVEFMAQYHRLIPLMGKQAAMKHMMTELFLGVNSNGELYFSNEEVKNIMNMDAMRADQPGATLKELYGQQIGEMNIQRSKLRNQVYSLDQTARNQEADAYTQQAIQLINESKANGTFDTADLTAIVDHMRARGMPQARIAQIAAMATYTNEAKATQETIETMQWQAKHGQLTPDMVYRANLPPKQHAQMMRLATQTNSQSYKDTLKDAKAYITSSLKGVFSGNTNYYKQNTTQATPSLILAARHAYNKYISDYQSQIDMGASEADANKFARSQFDAEIAKAKNVDPNSPASGQSSGLYRYDETAGSFVDPKFQPLTKIDGIDPKDVPGLANAKKVLRGYPNDIQGSIKRRLMVPKSEVVKYAQELDINGKMEIPPVANYIARETGVPAHIIMQEQAALLGVELPSQKDGTVDASITRLNQTSTPANSQVAANLSQQGQQGLRDPSTMLPGVSAVTQHIRDIGDTGYKTGSFDRYKRPIVMQSVQAANSYSRLSQQFPQLSGMISSSQRSHAANASLAPRSSPTSNHLEETGGGAFDIGNIGPAARAIAESNEGEMANWSCSIHNGDHYHCNYRGGK